MLCECTSIRHCFLMQAIQDDFVEMRKTDHKSMTVEDFHTLLNVVR